MKHEYMECLFQSEVCLFQAYGLDISAYKNVTAWLACCQSEMPGYEEVNAPGAEALGKAVLSRLQGNKI
jgi:hypothetical protein